MPGANDKRLLEQILLNNKSNKSLKKDIKNDSRFIVSHYAKPVTYSIEGFVEKNSDDVSGNMKVLFQGSTLGLV